MCAALASPVTGGHEARPAPQFKFRVKDIQGVGHGSGEWQGKKAAVFFFVALECPISAGYSAEIRRIAGQYAGAGFIFYAVVSDPTVRASRATRRRFRDFGYDFPVLLDGEQTLAKRLLIEVTPEVAVVSPAGELLYRGRIDDRFVSLGKYRDKPTRQDLRITLDAIAAGHTPPARSAPAVGCYLPEAPKHRRNYE